MTTEAKAIKRIHYNESASQHSGMISEIVSFGDMKFKVIAEVHNGGSSANIQVMIADGSFKLILSKLDLAGAIDIPSYVEDPANKLHKLRRVIEVLENKVIAIYG